MGIVLIVVAFAAAASIVAYRLYQRFQLARLLPLSPPIHDAEPDKPHSPWSEERVARLLGKRRRILFAIRQDELIVLIAPTGAAGDAFLRSRSAEEVRRGFVATGA